MVTFFPSVKKPPGCSSSFCAGDSPVVPSALSYCTGPVCVGLSCPGARASVGCRASGAYRCLLIFTPVDQDNYQQLLGALDYSFLCAYAVGMYLR